jgi:Ser/Thr protein kinase RdoA (MazF antagonist)
MKEFYGLTYRGRALRLRRLAHAALQEYDLAIKRLRLITIEMNGIFRVDTTDGRKYILRITDPSSCHGLEEIRSEMMWLAALRHDSQLGVPEPLLTRQGALVTTVEQVGVPEARHCVVFGWVPGIDLAQRLSAENVSKLGELGAHLHNHAQAFVPPQGFRIRTLDKVFPYADLAFADVEPVVIFQDRYRHLFPPARRVIYERAVEQAQETLDKLYADGQKPRVIHNDLHQWNVRVYHGQIFALDFEDLAWGYPVQDIATTLYYFQGLAQRQELVDAYKQGYTKHGEWPEEYPGQIETLIVGRGVMLVNYLVASNEPEDQADAPAFVAREEERLRRFLDEYGRRESCLNYPTWK